MFFFIVPLDNFSLRIAEEGRQNKAYGHRAVRVNSLTCDTFCETGHPFVRYSPRAREIHTCYRAFVRGTVIRTLDRPHARQNGLTNPAVAAAVKIERNVGIFESRHTPPLMGLPKKTAH